MEPRTCPHSTCGHTWTPRKADPKKCPQCQNPLWRSPRPKRQKQVVVQEIKYSLSDLETAPQGEWLVHPEKQGPECVHAPEIDSLSEAKARAEELLRKLA